MMHTYICVGIISLSYALVKYISVGVAIVKNKAIQDTSKILFMIS